MKLSMVEYCVIDTIARYPKIAISKLSENLHIPIDKTSSIIKKLVTMNLMITDPETNRIKAAPAWFTGNQSSPPSAPAVKEYTIVTRIRNVIIEEFNPDYAWDVISAKSAVFLTGKFKERFLKKHNRTPSDDELLDSFRHFIISLPDPYNKNWDLKGLNSNFNLIIGKLKIGSRGKLIDSAIAIEQSVSEMAAGKGFQIKKDY